MKILIIEDNAAEASALCRLLHERMEFVDCRIAGTWSEGKRIAHEFQADVTVSDIELPDATREEVLRGIKDLPPPVVIVSAYLDDDADLVAQCWAHGAKGVLSKRDLLERIETIEGVIKRARFIDAVTGSHLRATAPKELASMQHGFPS